LSDLQHTTSIDSSWDSIGERHLYLWADTHDGSFSYLVTNSVFLDELCWLLAVYRRGAWVLFPGHVSKHVSE